MPSAGPDSSERGFTLIEVLVALAIAGLALIAIFEGASAGMRSVDLAQRYLTATRIAQAHMAEVGAVIPFGDGEKVGTDAAGYRWRVRVKPARITGGDAQAPRGATLYAVESVVSWGPPVRPRTVRLETLRLANPAAAGRR